MESNQSRERVSQQPTCVRKNRWGKINRCTWAEIQMRQVEEKRRESFWRLDSMRVRGGHTSGPEDLVSEFEGRRCAHHFHRSICTSTGRDRPKQKDEMESDKREKRGRQAQSSGMGQRTTGEKANKKGGEGKGAKQRETAEQE